MKSKVESYDNLEDANKRIAELNEEVKSLKKKIREYKSDIKDLECAVSNANDMVRAARYNKW